MNRVLPILLVCLAALAGAAGTWLFSGATRQAPPAPKQIDGLVVEIDDGRIELLADGAKSKQFEIPAARQATIDVNHLRSHAALGLATRVHYEHDGERLMVVATEDAPVQVDPLPPTRSMTTAAFESLQIGDSKDEVRLEVGPPRLQESRNSGDRRLDCWQWDSKGTRTLYEACFAADSRQLVSKRAGVLDPLLAP